jgi:formylglycine-generating enzyme required for sulfatase activity
MNRKFASLTLVCATFIVAPLAASAQVTIAWSYVGNPNNSADTTVMDDGTTGYGSVSHAYNIGTYDVTNSQYVAFLNSNDPTGANTLGLYDSFMSSAPYGGIDYNSSAANGSKYSVNSGDGNHPVNYETWYSAIRFANWLDNGQVPGSTETGAYTLLGPYENLGGTAVPSNADSITRNPGASIFLPSENEWYKAAYYNPATASYYQYATSSNTAPNASGPTAILNSANYNAAVGNLTDVGAYSNTTSPYGAFDMGGNAWQWNETLIILGSAQRGARGGPFDSSAVNLLSSDRDIVTPTAEGADFGFRVAMIPEPSTAVLAVVAGAMWSVRKRFK